MTPTAMRIIVDARPMAEPIRGGVGRVALELVDAFASANPESEVVCATTGSSVTRLASRLTDRPNVRHVHLKIPNKLWSLASTLGFVSFCAAVERRCGKADAFFMPNLGFMGRLPEDAPSVLLLHDLSFLIEPRWFTLKQRLWHRAVKATGLIRGATRLLAVSETTKRDAIRLLGIPADRIDVIPLGSTLFVPNSRLPTHDSPTIDYRLSPPEADPPVAETIDPSTGLGASSPTHDSRLTDSPSRYVLALGLGDPRKNAATAIEAVAKLRKEEGFEDLGLILVEGEKICDVISSLSRNLPIGRSLGIGRQTSFARDDNFFDVILHPTDPELAALYANAAAFLYPSWYEGFGLPLHEAASFGTPCVASTSGALPETAPPGTLFADPAKPQHWVEALKLALGQPHAPRPIDPHAWTRAAENLRASLRG